MHECWGTPFLRRLGLAAVAGSLLWAAPGRIPYFSIFGGEPRFENLPGGWCLAVDGGSKAAAVFIPAQDGAGRVLIECDKVDPAHPPTFRAVGRQSPTSIPAPCEVEMTWDVHFVGPSPVSGKEAVMSLTQSSLMNRANFDLIAAHGIPGRELGQADGGWVRYSFITKIQGQPAMDILYICYYFSVPGRYLFKPPVLTLILPDGTRRPYPDGTMDS